MRWIAVTFVLVALGIIAVSATVFFVKLGMPYDKVTHDHLALFGTYFGGVAGPLLAFLTVAGLALTIMMQNRQIEQVAEANLKDQHVRMLIEIGNDLVAMESQHLDGNLTLGDVLSDRGQLGRGTIDAFKKLLPRYVQVLGYYAEGVALYRDNVSPYFDCRAFEQRGLRLLDRVMPHEAHLDQMGRPALAFIRGHLENTLQQTGRIDVN
ncbi:hypothetical protein [Lysobacter sp. CA199]|uniref:hypothetical protein n=1 Tax=Lysobacter sp. CA199 TaxID=3455608 RepID=UPI003F8D6649